MAFAISGGALRALESAPSALMSAFPGYSMALSVNQRHMTYGEIYRRQPAVRTVVSFLARNVGHLSLQAFRRVSDLDRERLTDHPLAALLAEPNPRTTQFRLIRALVSDLGIYDDAYWIKLRAENGQPVGLRRIEPWRVEGLGPEWRDPDQYRIHGSAGHLDVDADNMVHFRGYNPSDARHGCSPMEALRQVLAEEYEAARWREQMWRNGARLSGYLSRPTDAPGWDEPAKERFRRSWRAQYVGDGPQAGGTPILEDGMTFVPASVNPREAQYVESRKLTREECAAEYHIAPPLVGILDHATFSNIKEQHKSLYQDTLGPICHEIEQEVGLQLVRELPASDRVYVEFNIREKLEGSFEEQAQQLQAAVGAPYMTRSEARARQNLPHLPEADELIVPLNVITGGLASPQDTAPPKRIALPARKTRTTLVKTRAADLDTTGAKMLESFFRRQQQVVMSRLGAGKARGEKATIGELWDAPRWDRELAADLLKLGLKVAAVVARKVLTALGLDPDGYDEPRTAAFQQSVAQRVASSVNTATRAQLVDALAEADDEDQAAAVEQVFDRAVGQRAPEGAATYVTNLSGFASAEAVKQTGRTSTKTWLVTSSNPRPTHAAMNQVSVDLDAKFPNGAEWPADPALAVDEVAGCKCELEITVEDDDED